ncbi:glycerophosphoryl diester phosphodiesterase, periplasmic [Phenylobacterium zucineum HLK1]|uniref:glycerophosphodiester phosphodiesterase n=1 Tax=Phenylobacterium zucineum (strain HLK1) TaxID=450851 RepID=B4RAL3_PHEZH|nr:glycerophosphodiester phosphodiesterase [Phenylobacterium zucineum]ACG79611.1 glycerophosphoryl diester phosphodiesterase, periplasmic [Phenylobacterium zucineum HLK1]
MSLTRRTLAISGLVAVAAPAFAKPALAKPALAKSGRPLVIAHRGASGERPEHTLTAYKLAIEQGCDFIEPDLVPTRDGHLVARHENEIGGTTDVAQRPEFAARKATKVIDGETVEGWFTEDFTLAELKTLRARERLPQLRPGSAKFDGQEAIPTFQEVLELAKARGVGVYPEMKHPGYFSRLGLALEGRVAEVLKANGLDSRTAPVFVQCFEAGPLKTFGTLSKARRVFLVSLDGGPADRPGTTYAQMLTPAGLKEVAGFAEGLGPEWPLVIPVADGALAPPSPLVREAHAAGLQVHPWTVRAENHFLPKALQGPGGPAGHGDAAALLKALYAAGVDGVFSDFPALAVKARG